MLKKRDKNKVNKSKNTIVGGLKDENISIMSIKDKLKLLINISNLSFIKQYFKNSPFDKGPDNKYKTVENFLEINKDPRYNVALQIIKYILMCLYLGDDECYYYLEKYIRSDRINISTGVYKDNDTIFPNIKEYKLEDDNHNKYKNDVELLFKDLKSKIDDDLGVSRNIGKFSRFVDEKYKYRLYLRINVENQNNPKINNVELYVPNKYNVSVTDNEKKKLMISYNDVISNKENSSFKKVLNTDIHKIIEDIRTNNADKEDIIVIMQNYKKELLNKDILTGTMIIGFINSLYDTPSIHTEYVNILYNN